MCVTVPIQVLNCRVVPLSSVVVAVQHLLTGVVRTTEAAVIFVCQPLVVMPVLVLQASLSPLTSTPAPIVSIFSIAHSKILYKNFVVFNMSLLRTVHWYI